MQSLSNFLAFAIDRFRLQGVIQPERQAQELVCDALEIKLSQLSLQGERVLTSEEIERCQSWLARRAQAEPLAYIHGKVEFYACEIYVSPAVLIPRQETEILVDKIVKSLEQKNVDGHILWDVCCGSGCIGIALKKRLPQLQIVLSDLSPHALEVAAFNATRNGVEVEFLQGDLLKPFKGRKAHYIVCNPPYIAEREYAHLDPSVRLYEPRMALIGGEQGTEFYEALAQDLPTYLYPAAKVWLEVGYQQGSDMMKLFQGGFWKSCRLEQDWAGHDRFFFLENE